MLPAPILSLKLHLKSENFVSNLCIFCLSASQEQQRTTIAVGMVNKTKMTMQRKRKNAKIIGKNPANTNGIQ